MKFPIFLIEYILFECDELSKFPPKINQQHLTTKSSLPSLAGSKPSLL